jgi:hypothetical protein
MPSTTMAILPAKSIGSPWGIRPEMANASKPSPTIPIAIGRGSAISHLRDSATIASLER